MARLHAIKRGISSFPRARILSRRLAKIFRGGSHVQKVVSDLKQQAEVCGVFRNRIEFFFFRAGDAGAATRRRANQRAGFSMVDEFQFRGGHVSGFRREIACLTRDHPLGRSCGARNLGYQMHPQSGRQVFVFSYRLKREGL